MVKKITIKETRAPYTIPVSEEDLGEGPVVLERDGEAVAAPVPIEEYRQFVAWREEVKRAAIRQDQLQKFEREREAYLRLKPQLLQTHPGRFVAIYQGKVVDVDQDKQALAKRVIERYGNEPVYIQLVAEELRTFEIPSPETEPHASI